MGETAEFLVEHDPNFRRARLPALYSDFRSQRALNPDGFQANTTAWAEGLSLATREGRIFSSSSTPDLLILSVDDHLLRSLEYKHFGQPLALGSVVNQAILDKRFIPLAGFLRATESIYHRSWVATPKSVLNWALQQLWTSGDTQGTESLPTGHFVVLRNVESAAKVLDAYAATAVTPFDRTFTKSHFYKIFSKILVEGQCLSKRDLDVFLKYMSRDTGALTYDDKTVKMRGCSTSPHDNCITEEDAAIAAIKELTEDIQSQIAAMGMRVEDLRAKAKQCIARSNRISAMALLKSKRLTEDALQKRYATLAQLEEIAHKMQQAVNQVQLVDVMKASTGALHILNQQVGGVEKVEQVVNKLRDQMDEVDELGNVLVNTGSVDEAELNDELARLEEGFQSASGEQHRVGTAQSLDVRTILNEAPSVPSVIQRATERELEQVQRQETLPEDAI